MYWLMSKLQSYCSKLSKLLHMILALHLANILISQATSNTHSLISLKCLREENASQKMSRDARKLDYCLCENKVADRLCSNCTAINPFVFATPIVQFLFFLNPKFQAFELFLGLYRPVCVRPDQKPRRLVFSRPGSNTN